MDDRALRDLIRSGEAGRLRQAQGISQAAMARGLGIDPAQLNRYENGRRMPRPAFAARWLRVLRGLARHERVTAEIAAKRRAA